MIRAKRGVLKRSEKTSNIRNMARPRFDSAYNNDAISRTLSDQRTPLPHPHTSPFAIIWSGHDTDWTIRSDHIRGENMPNCVRNPHLITTIRSWRLCTAHAPPDLTSTRRPIDVYVNGKDGFTEGELLNSFDSYNHKRSTRNRNALEPQMQSDDCVQVLCADRIVSSTFLRIWWWSTWSAGCAG